MIIRRSEPGSGTGRTSPPGGGMQTVDRGGAVPCRQDRNGARCGQRRPGMSPAGSRDLMRPAGGGRDDLRNPLNPPNPLHPLDPAYPTYPLDPAYPPYLLYPLYPPYPAYPLDPVSASQDPGAGEASIRHSAPHPLTNPDFALSDALRASQGASRRYYCPGSSFCRNLFDPVATSLDALRKERKGLVGWLALRKERKGLVGWLAGYIVV